MNDDGAIGSAWPGRAWLWLSAWRGSVTLGRRRRSLDSDLDISTHRSEISGKVARPFFRRSLEGDLDISTHRLEISGRVARPLFFLRKVARRRERGRTHARTDAQNFLPKLSSTLRWIEWGLR